MTSSPESKSIPATDQAKPETSANASTPTENINLDTNLLTITTENDLPYILKECRKRLLVLEFFAKWCGPCMNLSSKLDELASAYKGKILLVKVDVDEFDDLISEYDISVIPTFVLIKNQKKLGQFTSSDIAVIVKKLKKHAGKSGFKLK